MAKTAWPKQHGGCLDDLQGWAVEDESEVCQAQLPPTAHAKLVRSPTGQACTHTEQPELRSLLMSHVHRHHQQLPFCCCSQELKLAARFHVINTEKHRIRRENLLLKLIPNKISPRADQPEVLVRTV